MEYIVGVGEYAISTNKEDIVKTFALATCVAVIIYDTNKKILAMAHILLPNTINQKEEESHNSARYADTAVYKVFNEMEWRYGCHRQDLKVTLFGGITSEMGDRFKIGERNLAVIREILDEMNIKYDSLNTGGRVSRTLIAYTATGEIEVKSIPIT